jgi:hypothetical protein
MRTGCRNCIYRRRTSNKHYSIFSAIMIIVANIEDAAVLDEIKNFAASYK